MSSEQTFRTYSWAKPSFSEFYSARLWSGELGFRISKELVRAATVAGGVFGVSESTLHYSLRERKPDVEELEGKRIRLWTLIAQRTASKMLVDLSSNILHKQQADFTGYNRRD